MKQYFREHRLGYAFWRTAHTRQRKLYQAICAEDGERLATAADFGRPSSVSL